MREKLANAIEESLLFAPDAAGVLMGVHAGITRRRRRQRRHRITGAIALVVLAVATSVLVTTRTRKPPPAEPRPGNEWPSTLHVGWLPDDVHPLTSHVSTQAYEELRYGELGDRVRMTVNVDNIDLSDRIQGSTMHRIEINGRPALEPAAPDGFDAVVIWQLPSGRWASLRIEKATDQPAALQATGIRVAESVRETRELVRTGFAPTYLPVGERVIGVSMDIPATGRGYVVCASGPLGLRPESARFEGIANGLPADLGLSVTIALLTDLPGYLSDRRVRIADIQGRTAYWRSAPGTVMVSDYHGGWLLVSASTSLDGPKSLDAQRNPLPQAELVKVAEGVRWVG